MRAELSPVTDFRESCCRQHEMGECTRGGYCNFMHMKSVTRKLKKELFASQKLMIKNRERAKEAGGRHNADEKDREDRAQPPHLDQQQQQQLAYEDGYRQDLLHHEQQQQQEVYQRDHERS